MRTLYLHGFASSPASRKARLFVEKMAAEGVRVEALTLAPDFEHLTISSQLQVIENTAQGEQVVLIGSSMGGYLAALYAAAHPEVERLVLMAPAFDFYQLWIKETGPQRMEEWRINGTTSVFHYGTGRETPLGYQLMEDARQYTTYPEFQQPCLILHGRRDEVVPFEQSRHFADTHSNVTLVGLETGHEMTDVLDEIWKISSTFLLRPSTEVA